MNPLRLFTRQNSLVIKFDRLLHDTWATWCAKVGPKLKIVSVSPCISEHVLIRAESITAWKQTLEDTYYKIEQGSRGIKHPGVSLYHLKDVSIIGRESFAFTGKHTMLRLDPSMDGAPKRKIRRPIGFMARRIKGTSLSLGSRYTDNHFHFLFEHLPLILLAREYLGENASLNILITPNQAWWQTEYLVRLGENPEKIIELTTGTMQCDDAWLIPNLALTDRVLPYEANVYREIARRFKKGITPRRKNRSLFITRKDATRRRLQNEDDVFAELQKTYPDLERITLSRISLQDQLEHFSEAAFVIGPAGQAFRNILFCDGALCIELTPGCREPKNIYGEWTLTTTHLGMIHGNRYLPLYAEEHYAQNESDWTFPIETLKRALQRLESMGEIAPLNSEINQS